jgi:hypothetical protein
MSRTKLMLPQPSRTFKLTLKLIWPWVAQQWDTRVRALVRCGVRDTHACARGRGSSSAVITRPCRIQRGAYTNRGLASTMYVNARREGSSRTCWEKLSREQKHEAAVQLAQKSSIQTVPCEVHGGAHRPYRQPSADAASAHCSPERRQMY